MENNTEEIVNLAKQIEIVRKQNEKLSKKNIKRHFKNNTQKTMPSNLVTLNNYEPSVFMTYEDISNMLVYFGISTDVTSEEDARAFVRMFNLHPSAQLKEDPSKRGRGHFLFFRSKVKAKMEIVAFNKNC